MFCVSNRPIAKTATNASGSARSSPSASIRVTHRSFPVTAFSAGNCVSVCPQHAKEDISDVAQIQELIASGQQVVVSVDSSYIAYFDTPGFSGIEEPLKKLGFAAAHETAEGAYLVKKQLEELARQPGDAPDHYIRLFDDRALCGKASAGGAAIFGAGALPDAGACRAAAQAYPGATLSTSARVSPRRRRRRALRASVPITTSRSRSLRTGCMEAGVAVNPNVPADEPMLSRGYTITNGVLHSMSLDSGRDYLFLDGLDDSIQTLKSVVNRQSAQLLY